MRLNKYIASCGVTSRRGADELIAAGRVLVNGKAPSPGESVETGDVVSVDGKVISNEGKRKIVIAYNKPVGIVCSSVDQGDEHNNIIDAIGYPERIFPIGRLDKDSEGLILLTNDGELSDELMRAANNHEKEYEVTVDKKLTSDFIKEMSKGVDITFKDGSIYHTRKCAVSLESDYLFRIILTEGKNRQIRRMCEALGYTVVSLKRIRVDNIMLDGLRTGEYRELGID